MGHTDKLIKLIRGIVSKTKEPSRTQTLILIDELSDWLKAEHERAIALTMSLTKASGEMKTSTPGRKKVLDTAFKKRAEDLRADGKSLGKIESILKQEFPNRVVTINSVRNVLDARTDTFDWPPKSD